MAKRSPAFQFYPKDWRDFRVRRMSNEAKGVYMDILADMWADSPDQCSILNDDVSLARAYGYLQACSGDDYRQCDSLATKWRSPNLATWLAIKAELMPEGDPIFLIEGNRLVSKRLREEAEKQAQFSEKQRKNGKAGNEKRWGKRGRRQCDSLAIAKNRSSSSVSNDASDDASTALSLFKNSESDDAHALATIVIAAWNAIAGVKPVNNPIPKGINEKLTRRLAEHPDPRWWRDYLARIERSDFLCGRVRDWSATFDWVLGPKNMEKILLGNYDNKAGTASVAKAPRCQFVPNVHIGPGRPKPCGQPPIDGEPYCELHRPKEEA